MHLDTLHRSLLFVGQLLVRTSCSFFVGSFLLQQQTPARYDHYNDSETERTGSPAIRQHTAIDKSLVDQDLLQLVEDIQNPDQHSAPSLSDEQAKQKYAELCSIYKKSCTNTLWDGAYDRSEKYLFQGLSIALLQQLDKRLSTTTTVQKTLDQLKIYQDAAERRGSAGHTTVKINSKNIPTGREFREVLTHELGHIVDLGVLQGSSSTKDSAFTEFGKVIWSKDDPSISFYKISRLSESTRKAQASFKDFVSGYAMKGVYEDFAETQNLRFNHNLLFQELANSNDLLAKKYAYFRNLYGNKWFDDNTASVSRVSLARRPWDTTRIESE